MEENSDETNASGEDQGQARVFTVWPASKYSRSQIEALGRLCHTLCAAAIIGLVTLVFGGNGALPRLEIPLISRCAGLALTGAALYKLGMFLFRRGPE